MRKSLGGWETVLFLGAASVLLLSAGGAAWLGARLHLHNPRLQYGLEHLPGALVGAFLFTLAVWLGWRALSPPDAERWTNKPIIFYLLLVTGVFCLFWLPPLLGGHFDEDDWQLLAAAAVRKVILLHPRWSWYALDSVDGNFRPLGTVLYFGYLFQWFSLWKLPYFAGLFVVNLLGSLTAFSITRAMGYSKVAGTAACLLYVSRSMTYEIRTWTSALGDALVILLCGCMAWALLRAVRKQGARVWAFHGLAWACFCLATLAKQSAFAAPLIAALLLLLEPGRTEVRAFAPRVWAASLALAVYGATAAAVFFHAKSLTRALTPYPIGFSFEALLRTFSYAVWYLGTFEFPSKIAWAWVMPSLLGLVIVAGVIAAVWKVPRLLGERPRDGIFCLGAAVASVSLFVVLSNRQAAYYGSMAAFWVSIALAIALTRPRHARETRMAAIVLCGLLVTGFVDVRLQQTGLIPSGGYTWGTYTGTFAQQMYEAITRELAAAPHARVLVLEDMPGYPSHYTAMALLTDPRLESILTYSSNTRQFFANDLQGARPKDEFAALNDVHAYNWTVPLESAEAARISSRKDVLWLKFQEGKIMARN